MARFQKAFELASGFRVIGWSAHVYHWRLQTDPPSVGVVHRTSQITTTFDLTPDEARLFANALNLAADAAESAPSTADDPKEQP